MFVFLFSFYLHLRSCDGEIIMMSNINRVNKPKILGDKFHFAIDRGGTFTDVHATLPSGEEYVTKLLSVDPQNYPDAPTEGIRRILEVYDKPNGPYPRGTPLNTSSIGSIRMGTTVATNALLERKGARTALVITKGFRDLLAIGNQSRPNIFDLTIATPDLIYERVVEVDERVMLEKYLTSVDISPTVTEVESSFLCDSFHHAPTDGPRVRSVTGETYIQMRIPDLELVRRQLQPLLDEGIHSLAVVFLHSFAFPQHEQMVGELAKHMGFREVSLSSSVMPMVKMTPRGHTACAAAYLTPSIVEYVQMFTKGFDQGLKDVRLDFMASDGGKMQKLETYHKITFSYYTAVEKTLNCVYSSFMHHYLCFLKLCVASRTYAGIVFFGSQCDSFRSCCWSNWVFENSLFWRSKASTCYWFRYGWNVN